MAAADIAGTGYGGAPSPDPEGPDGVRMTWNTRPRSKVEASKCVVPIAASISPIRSHPDVLVLPYTPLRCKPPCSAALNPFCTVDFSNRIWTCPLLLLPQRFPPSLPRHLQIQRVVSTPHLPPSFLATTPPVFLFILDTCVIEEELAFLKSAM